MLVQMPTLDARKNVQLRAAAWCIATGLERVSRCAQALVRSPQERMHRERYKPQRELERAAHAATAASPIRPFGALSAQLPGGARMAVWVIVNVEEWDPKDTMPRTVLTPPAGGSPTPDIPNWCWHEYGKSVGFWHLIKVFDDSRSLAARINGYAIEAFPPIVKAALERKWEFIGHGFTQRTCKGCPTSARISVRRRPRSTM